MRKIRNVIFDLGNVLLKFNPDEYLTTLFDDAELITRVHKAVFTSPEWYMLDRGVITQDQAVRRLVRQYPDLGAAITLTFEHWMSMLKPFSANVEVVRSLKKTGYDLYVLSNFHKAAFEYVYSRYEWFSLFDGMIISYQHQTLKPEPAIYQILLATYSLIPEQCVFIDDSLANLAAASEFGIRGIHYETSEQLRLELNYILK
ncbi:MAG TPA: HAD family phosphatase [Firmicutes bacterium]|nr:HAD family phosphatase [Bacillota bacterium]HHT43728.1 HAD family phosphatase [Bacillota bacterium]